MEGGIERGARLVLTIDDVAYGGDGVGRSAGRVVFVPFALDGDEAEVEIVEVKRRYARARLLRICRPSPRRVAPPCPYYGRCGGCRLQHADAGHQQVLKARQVRELFVRIAGLPDPPLTPLIASPRPFAYRIKADLHLSGGVPRKLGFMAPSSRELVEVTRCELCETSINEKIACLREALRGGEAGPAGDRLTLWADDPGAPPATVSEGPSPPVVTRTVGGRRIDVAHDGFFQANGALIGGLIETVQTHCALSGGETLLDAYGGCGLFSLFLGPRAGRLYGIEGDREAVRLAGINLRRAGLAQATFYRGDVGQVIARELLPRRIRTDVVLLDPPRDGCDGGALAGAAALEPERIVYVSCNPATQARDCAALARSGYRLRRLTPLDMFPQTAHIETVALLTRGTG